MPNDIATVILAAGLGTRMKSRQAKVLHQAAGQPLIAYPVELARALPSHRVICVLGHQATAVQDVLDARFGAGAVEVVLQAEQRGTGHAVLTTAEALAGFAGRVLILYGDVPALTSDTLRRLVAASQDRRLALVTTRLERPSGYGRIVRDADGRVARVVEERDASAEERRIDEINAGIYCVEAGFLYSELRRLEPDNAQGELYLTDVIARAAAVSEVSAVEARPEEVLGVNDRVDLARLELILSGRTAERWMRAGVTIRLPETCRIDAQVTIGPDTEIEPLVRLAGATRIGANVHIGQGCVLIDADVRDGAYLKPYSVVSESVVGEEAQLGPFAHLRPGTTLEAKVKIGNFVETKQAHFGRGAKASHLSYLGDADIGSDVNVGCGTITCNYDGYRKSRTVIEAGAFIGSDTQLVAPVRVGAGAIVGAGTTVVKDIPPGALALARTPQIAIEGYAEKKKQREAERRALSAAKKNGGSQQ